MKTGIGLVLLLIPFFSGSAVAGDKDFRCDVSYISKDCLTRYDSDLCQLDSRVAFGGSAEDAFYYANYDFWNEELIGCKSVQYVSSGDSGFLVCTEAATVENSCTRND